MHRPAITTRGAEVTRAENVIIPGNYFSAMSQQWQPIGGDWYKTQDTLGKEIFFNKKTKKTVFSFAAVKKIMGTSFPSYQQQQQHHYQQQQQRHYQHQHNPPQHYQVNDHLSLKDINCA